VTAQVDDLLVADGIVKRYGHVQALVGADFSCRAGEIHAVLGENGAGKSTLIKVLGGTVRQDAGTVRVAGEELSPGHPQAALGAGIVAVYQELSLIGDLTVAENIFLLREPLRPLRLIDGGSVVQQTCALFRNLGIKGIDPDRRAGQLSLAEKQIVEIAKAAARDPRIIILDEPTSALAQTEVAWLLDLMKRWRSEGKAIVFISHRYGEVKATADRLSIYRNGKRVAVYTEGEASDAEVITAMCGRPVETLFPALPELRSDAPTTLDVRDVSGRGLHGVSFAVRRGEILGVGGLAGQGQLDLFLALFGAMPHSGQTRLHGRAVRLRRPQDAVRAGVGIALVPAERKTEGLLLARSVRENMTLPSIRLLSRFGFVRRGLERERVQTMIHTLNIAVSNDEEPVRQLSGGNQQKVVIGKWLLSGASILLLYDVTRGVDVATKAQIYQLITDAVSNGATVLFYSTDTQEMVHLCHRVLVMYEGRVVHTVEGNELNEREIISAAIGHGSAGAA
jgi:ribose transport system ATP-binding protein